MNRVAVGVESDRAEAHLERRVATAASAIEREVAADLEVLYALRSWFELDVPVTRQRFTMTAQPFLDRHPSINALEWAPRTARVHQQLHDRDARGDGAPGDSTSERTTTGTPAAAGEHGWYYPVTFVERGKGNISALGSDLGSDRLCRQAMDRAVGSGQPALTDPISLSQETPGPTGTLGFLAVFSGGSEMSDAQSRALRGFVIAVFDLNDLLQQALRVNGSMAPSGIRFELVDGDVDGRTLAVPQPGTLPIPRPVTNGSVEETIDIGGQHWHLVANPTAAYLRSLRTSQPVLLGVTATIAWELLVGLVFVVGRRSRDRLERRHARLMSNILESLRDGVIVADTAGTILTANRAAIRMTGQGRADIPPAAWSESYGLFVPGTDTPFPPEELPLARAIRGEATEGVEILVKNTAVPEGTHVSVNGAPMLNSRGSVRGGVAVFRDISERKRAEEHLRRLSSAVEQTADSVLITDRNGTIEYVNPAFEETTGYASAEVLGRNPNILKSGLQSQDYYRELWSTILRGEPFRGTTVNRKKDGTLYHAEQTITAIKDTEGHITHFVSVLKDMTERRKLQEKEIEMELAAQVQRRLFPATAPQIAGYDLAGAVFPALATSGDYFDFIRTSDNALAIVVADVSGHGVGPALVMAEVRAHLRSLLHTTNDLVSIMKTISLDLASDLGENQFVTMLLIKMDPASGRCSYVNSGHPSGFVVDGSGAVAVEMNSVCLPLGLFPDRWQCTEHCFGVGNHDTVVLVTDGVLETTGPYGEEFGRERLLEILSEHRQRPAREIVDVIRTAVREFAHGAQQTDDLTVVICKRH